MKNILALLLAVILCFSYASCSQENVSDNTVKQTQTSSTKVGLTTQKNVSTRENIALYFSYSDSLDPYIATTAGNRAICSLLYDSLIKLDENLNPQYLIARDALKVGKTITISLGSHQFSDGSYVTAEDVIYSIERLKASKNTEYSGSLENIATYSASADKVVLTLNRDDRNAVRLLDFPIIKRQSANKTNDDGKAIPPIGSGRYVFVDNKGEFSLTGNEYYSEGKPKKDIELKNIPDYEALEYLIRSNSIDIYYSGFDLKEMPQISGNTNTVNLTNLVYVGINQKRAQLGDKNIRKALSLSVDRLDVAEKCYYSLSVPALSLFNDKNDVIKNEASIFNLEDNVLLAYENLKKSGYSNLNKEGYYAKKSGEKIELSLLYNSDNATQSLAASTLVKNFKASGINVKSFGVSANEYKNAIKNEDYDLYVGEIRLTKSFDYTNLLNTKNVLASSDKKNKTDFLSVYKKYMAGNIEIKEMLESFEDENPFIPLVFRVATVSYSNRISGELISTIGDPYANIEKLYLR